MAESNEGALRVLTKRGSLPGRWVSICIDRYMVGEGNSPEDAVESLYRVCRAEMTLGTGDDPLGHVPEAPPEYREEYEKRRAESRRDVIELSQLGSTAP